MTQTRRADHFVLVVEPSQKDSALWRFGRANSPTRNWGLLTADPDTGSIQLLREEQDVSLSDYVTAACLVRMAKVRKRIEYDLTPQYGPFPSPTPIRRQPRPEQKPLTLGERAAARRAQSP